MATIWLTYAWADNKDDDVDFIAQELGSIIDVKLDRWNISAGKRLWDQIENFIQNPDECDAWVLYATQNSLSSEPCKEEYAYALDRALNTRGDSFPVIGLFPGPVDKNLIPAGIRTRLYVSITDPDWKERVVSAVKGVEPKIKTAQLEPYVLNIHTNIDDKMPGYAYIIEVRPRAGVWAPFSGAFPADEKENVAPYLVWGAKDSPVNNAIMNNLNTQVKESSDGEFLVMVADNIASPTHSYFLWCKQLPSKFTFGVNKKGGPLFTWTKDS